MNLRDATSATIKFCRGYGLHTVNDQQIWVNILNVSK